MCACVCVKMDTVLGMYLFYCIVCDVYMHVCEIEKLPSCSYGKNLLPYCVIIVN